MPDLRDFLFPYKGDKPRNDKPKRVEKKMDGLKPCVLCGTVHSAVTTHNGVKAFEIMCDCGRGSCSFNESLTIKSWNDQADDREKAELSKHHMEKDQGSP